MRLALVLTLAALPAAAQDAVSTFRGAYGSAADPATSCAANPHQLDFMASPPHALFNWQDPWIDQGGTTVTGRRYDLLDHDAATLTLRLEGDTARTDDGRPPTWILRLTANPSGYCWGRADWPVVRCEDRQLRCDEPTS